MRIVRDGHSASLIGTATMAFRQDCFPLQPMDRSRDRGATAAPGLRTTVVGRRGKEIDDTGERELRIKGAVRIRA